MFTPDYYPVSINGAIASQAEIPNSATLVPSTFSPSIQCPRPADASPTVVLSSSLSFSPRMSLPHSTFVLLHIYPTVNFQLNFLPELVIYTPGREGDDLGSCLSRYPGKHSWRQIPLLTLPERRRMQSWAALVRGKGLEAMSTARMIRRAC